jgi:Ferritin-like domain
MAPPTRRELVQRAIWVAAAGVGAGGLLGPDPAAAASDGDDQVIRGLAATELLIVFVYRHVLALRLLGPASARIAARFAAQERAHVAVLAAELRRLRVAAPAGPVSVAAADHALAAGHATGSLAALRTAQDCLKLLVAVESLAEGAYFKAIGTLRNPALAQLAAQILACEAQHWTVLAELQYPGKIYSSVPWPYVTGTQ